MGKRESEISIVAEQPEENIHNKAMISLGLGGEKMNDLNVYLIRYHNNGYFCKSIVLAESYDEAERIILKDYNEFDIEIQIEEYEEIQEKRVALTECIKL